MPRIRFALARGEASSRGEMRKIGHIRTSGDCERHAPQPLQSRAASIISSACQVSCSVIGVTGLSLAAASSASAVCCALVHGERPQVLRYLPRFERHDLARIQQPLRIEDLLQLAEHIGERAELPAQVRRATEPVAMLAADRAAEQPDLFVQLRGQRLERRPIVGAGQIEKRPDVQLTVPRVAEERRGDLQPLEGVLRVLQEHRQRRRRHGHVLDTRHRARGALQPVERGHKAPRESPKELEVSFVFGDVRDSRERGLVLNQLDHFLELLPNIGRRFALLLDQQHRLGLARNQELVTHVVLACEIQMTPIHQVAGHRLERLEFEHRIGRLVEAVEHQEHAAAMHRERVDAHGGIDHERERALAADQQLRQIELAFIEDIVEHVVERVAAAIHQTLGTVLGRSASRVAAPDLPPTGRGDPVALPDSSRRRSGRRLAPDADRL